eukprot:1154352-Pelagomonas_calceolata.AAC.2
MRNSFSHTWAAFRGPRDYHAELRKELLQAVAPCLPAPTSEVAPPSEESSALGHSSDAPQTGCLTPEQASTQTKPAPHSSGIVGNIWEEALLELSCHDPPAAPNKFLSSLSLRGSKAAAHTLKKLLQLQQPLLPEAIAAQLPPLPASASFRSSSSASALEAALASKHTSQQVQALPLLTFVSFPHQQLFPPVPLPTLGIHAHEQRHTPPQVRPLDANAKFAALQIHCHSNGHHPRHFDLLASTSNHFPVLLLLQNSCPEAIGCAKQSSVASLDSHTSCAAVSLQDQHQSRLIVLKKHIIVINQGTG